MTFPDPRQHHDPDDQSPQQNHVRGLLGSLPDPGPMPDDLVTRIHARLADEELRRHSDSKVVDLTSRRRARIMGGLAAVGTVAAAAAVVGVVATGGLNSLTRSNANDALQISTPPASGRVNTFADVRIHRTDRALTEASLDAEASRLLGTRSSTNVEPGTAAFGPLGTVGGLQSCFSSHGIDAPKSIAAGIGTFDGKPALVAGVRTSGGEMQSWVLDAQCKEIVPHRVIN